MATIGNTGMTFADIAKRQEPDYKSIAQIAEVLNNQNDILKFLPRIS